MVAIDGEKGLDRGIPLWRVHSCKVWHVSEKGPGRRGDNVELGLSEL